MIAEIKTKRDFIVNHFILVIKGLLSLDKIFVNISASGIRFVTTYAAEVNDAMQVKLLLPKLPSVAFFGYDKVKRTDAIDDDKCEVAIEYFSMDESMRSEIIKYMLSHQQESIKRMRQNRPRK